MKMTSEQKDAIDKARTAAINLKKQADKARALGLTVLEQWLRDASVGCMAGADFQTRAMGDNLATQTQRVVMDGQPKTAGEFPGHVENKIISTTQPGPGGLRCEKCGHTIAECSCDVTPDDITKAKAEADALADAIKRRGGPLGD